MTTTTMISKAPPEIRTGDTVWLTDRTGPWKVMALQGDRALLQVVGSVTTARVLLTHVGRVKDRP